MDPATLTRRTWLEGTVGTACAVTWLGSAATRSAARSWSTGRCRALIAIVNVGGPGHLDLWDPKPQAPAEIRGPFRARATTVPGLQLSELLPEFARRAHRVAWLRACHHSEPALHHVGWSLLQTGCYHTNHSAPGFADAFATYRPPPTNLPGHVILVSSFDPNPPVPPQLALGASRSASFPLAPRASHNASFPLALCASPNASSQLADGRRSLPIDPRILAGSARAEHAVPLGLSMQPMTGPRVIRLPAGCAWETTAHARAAQAAVLRIVSEVHVRRGARQAYGASVLGDCCLAARCLVAAGVPCVTILTSGSLCDRQTWDTHGLRPGGAVRQLRDTLAPQYDRAVATLLDDLSDRGLLDQTLVCNLAEFGRAPHINRDGGRDHWPECWTSWLAGGGIQGGRVVGRSDRIGAEPVERPVTPAELLATIRAAAGMAPDGEDAVRGTAWATAEASLANPIGELF